MFLKLLVKMSDKTQQLSQFRYIQSQQRVCFSLYIVNQSKKFQTDQNLLFEEFQMKMPIEELQKIQKKQFDQFQMYQKMEFVQFYMMQNAELEEFEEFQKDQGN